MIYKDNENGPSREEMVADLRAMFPHLASADTALSDRRGGRQAAEAMLAAVQPQSYERTRNYLAGDVTRLSAYLRHGVLTLAEVRDHALGQVKDPRVAGKLVNEFAWRDYWQRLYAEMGEGIWQDREAYKTGFDASAYGEQLPAEISAGETTLRCMDSFAEELRDTGYLHNHARMWFAAYVVHWRRSRWQAGARWFLEHLLDGDPASNNLSWQWVASTFASKPYFFNRENLERYTAGVYCRECPHARAQTCPFEGEYEALEQTLFPYLHSAVEGHGMPPPPRPFSRSPNARSLARLSLAQLSGKALLWIHADALNPVSSMLLAHTDSPMVFVWDQKAIVASGWKLKRLVFVAECLREMPERLETRVGDPALEVLAVAKAAGVDHVLVQRTPDPALLAAAAEIEKEVRVVWYDPPPFVESVRGFDLKRFSRYWQRAQSSAMQLTRDGQ